MAICIEEICKAKPMYIHSNSHSDLLNLSTCLCIHVRNADRCTCASLYVPKWMPPPDAWNTLGWENDRDRKRETRRHLGFATGLRAIQNHAIFRDLRWDPADAHGILVVYEYPGLQIFMLLGVGLWTLCCSALLKSRQECPEFPFRGLDFFSCSCPFSFTCTPAIGKSFGAVFTAIQVNFNLQLWEGLGRTLFLVSCLCDAAKSKDWKSPPLEPADSVYDPLTMKPKAPGFFARLAAGLGLRCVTFSIAGGAPRWENCL